MVELKQEYPFIFNGEIKENLIKHYAEDEQGNRYKIRQKETGLIFNDAADIYPCIYTYEPTNILIEKAKTPEEIAEEERQRQKELEEEIEEGE